LKNAFLWPLAAVTFWIGLMGSTKDHPLPRLSWQTVGLTFQEAWKERVGINGAPASLICAGSLQGHSHCQVARTRLYVSPIPAAEHDKEALQIDALRRRDKGR
jgi:hypothetical protein